MTDDLELLAVRCQLGERSALEALVARWHLPLWKYARRLTGSEEAADEAVQDAWLRILRGLPRLREPARLRPWIFGIARRVLMDRLRVQYAALPLADVDVADLAEADEPGATTEDLDLLHGELASMPVLEREVLVLFYLDELSLADLADVLAIPIGTAKSRLFRARRTLRQRLDQPTRPRARVPAQKEQSR
jgi:RNA polymerase sigma-70 factor (ECF subfamily)